MPETLEAEVLEIDGRPPEDERGEPQADSKQPLPDAARFFQLRIGGWKSMLILGLVALVLLPIIIVTAILVGVFLMVSRVAKALFGTSSSTAIR